MIGARYPADLGSHGPLRSLDQLLAELVARYNALPMQHRDRGRLALRICEVEAAIDERTPLLEKFAAEHPEITTARFTILGIDRREPWLCIDGWFTPPDDQGPEPTDADIPMGFV